MKTNAFDIVVPTHTAPRDWQRIALKLAKAEAARRGIPWRDAAVFVYLPQRGRCYTKESGFVTLGAHG